MEQITIKSSHSIPDNDFANIKIFNEKSKVLWSHWESLDIKFPRSQSVSRDDSGKVSGDSVNIGEHIYKGLLLDFRIFTADKEPTYFNRIANVVGRYFRDDRVGLILNDLKNNWKEAGLLNNFCGYSADEVINILFNSKYFHVDEEKHKLHEEMKGKVSDELITDMLLNTVYDRIRVIRHLSWFTEELTISNQKIKLPKNWVDELVEKVEQDKMTERRWKADQTQKKDQLKRVEIHEEFNRTKSFSKEVIDRVRLLMYGHGATPEEIAEKTEGLTVADATGIVNNINIEAYSRCGESYKVI
jgi:O6-methylguanine-DNA--protein-cysteine methyltransferase